MLNIMKTLTIFTPTYNRVNLLPKLYGSLKIQTDKDFLWLVVDDGSADNTKELVEKWKSENHIEIQYFYKKNGGMHTAHNLAYQNINTELNVCIDSDDYMPENAVELILNQWKSVTDKTQIAGIIGLDADKNGNIIGTKIPENLQKGSLTDLYQKHGVKGDKKIVLRTDIVKKYPLYPEYENEKLVPLGILYLMIGKDYDFIYKNEIYCIVEYQPDGSSNTIFRQYKQSPRGFAYTRKVQIKYSDNISQTLKGYTHLISSALFAKDITLAFKQVNPLMTFVMLPFGVILNFYIKFRIKKH